MGLDACVYCDCYEQGRRTPPPQPKLVYVDACGQVSLHWDAPGADQFGFYTWLETSCPHGPLGWLVLHRIGNIALVGLLRSLLSRTPDTFPILLGKVVYDGTHAGDHLDVRTVEALQAEMSSLDALHCDSADEEEYLRAFERQMEELIAASLAVRKPIAF
jgi:hypothetical protein